MRCRRGQSEMLEHNMLFLVIIVVTIMLCIFLYAVLKKIATVGVG